MAIRKYPLVVVDICNRAIQQIILHEGESAGSVLPFQIVNNGVPLNLSGYDVNFYLIKPDGKKVLNSCDIKSPADGLVDYTITDQTVSMSGRGLINIQLIEGAKIAYSGGIRTEIEYTGMGSDSNEEVNLFSQIVEATKTSAEKAKEYAMSALEAYTQTEQALRETQNCQTKACNCAQAAQEALALATQAKKDAAAYATNAQTSADLAETSANAAEQSTADAAASAVAAKTSETNAKSSETAAADSAADASQSKVAAKASADSAKANADNAAISATTAGAQATTATNKAAEAAASATAAKGSQDAAALSAQAAEAKATAAIGSANTAERASNSAGVAATAAFDNANDAKASADKAKASETNAAGSASTARTIADNLQGTVTAAENATSRANTAAERAEQAAQTVQPDATKTRKGIVQIGDGINIDGGVISVPAPDLSGKADKVHTHSTSDITGLDAALNEAGKVKSVNGQTGTVTIAAVPSGGTAGQVLKRKSKGFGWEDDDDTQPDLTPYAKTTDLDKKVDKVNGKGLSTNDYTTDEKDKLAGIAEDANNYTLPTASAQTLGGIKVGTNLSIAADGTLNATDTTYNPATPTSPGLMSAADKVAVNTIGNASEAPSVMDKSSVWAAINEAASKGGGISMDTVKVAEALREKHVTVPANLEELDVPAAIRSINESHFGLWLANTMDTGTDGEKIAAVEHLDVPDYARSLDGMYGVSLDDRMVRTLYAYPRSWNAVLASPGAMTVLAASFTAMQAVAANPAAMQAVIANSAAMQAVIASFTAMQAVAANPAAMQAVIANSAAMQAVIASDNAKNALLNNYNVLLANREALWDAAQKMQLKLSSNADTVSGLNTRIPANCIVFAALGTYDDRTHKGRARIKHRNGFYSSYFGNRVNESTKTVTKSNFDVITFDGCTFEEEGDGFATVACFG